MTPCLSRTEFDTKYSLLSDDGQGHAKQTALCVAEKRAQYKVLLTGISHPSSRFFRSSQSGMNVASCW